MFLSVFLFFGRSHVLSMPFFVAGFIMIGMGWDAMLPAKKETN